MKTHYPTTTNVTKLATMHHPVGSMTTVIPHQLQTPQRRHESTSFQSQCLKKPSPSSLSFTSDSISGWGLTLWFVSHQHAQARGSLCRTLLLSFLGTWPWRAVKQLLLPLSRTSHAFRQSQFAFTQNMGSSGPGRLSNQLLG